MACSELRHEYIDGQAYVITGASRTHGLIVEVLSESTVRIDWREKLLAYQGLPSLQTYLLVEQDVQRAELYRRANGWQVEYVEQGGIRIGCLAMELPLAEVYADVPA